MLIGRVWICRLLYVCLFVNLSGTVTDFSAGNKASGIKFCTMVRSWASWAWNLSLWGTLLLQKPKIRRIGARFESVLFTKGHRIKGAGVRTSWTPPASAPEMFVKDEAKVSSRVGGVKWRVVYLGKLVFEYYEQEFSLRRVKSKKISSHPARDVLKSVLKVRNAWVKVEWVKKEKKNWVSSA